MALIASGTAAADTYTVDPVHSNTIFRVRHLNIGYIYGRFNQAAGTFLIDSADPTKSTFNITVKTESIDTHNAKRDNHLKSPDFFNARQFPEITFKSTKVKSVDEHTLAVTGDLTCHGVTKSVTMNVELTGEGNDPWGNYRAGLETVFTLKRSDFGMNFMMGPLGDDIKLMVAVEGIRKK